MSQKCSECDSTNIGEGSLNNGYIKSVQFTWDDDRLRPYKVAVNVCKDCGHVVSMKITERTKF